MEILMSGQPRLARRALIGSTALLAATLAGPIGWAQTSPPKRSSRKTDLVRVTYGRGGLPLLAKERGEFEKLLARDNIRVQWVGPFPNHAPSLQAVTGNSADFGFWGSSTPALAAMIAGSPLVFVNFGIYEPRSTAIIAKDGSGIDSVKDLVGKSVAVNRSGLGEFLLVAALEKHGIDRSKVRFVYLNPPDAGPAFAQGKIDAWSMWSPGVDIARLEYKAHDLFFEGRDLDFFIDFSSLVTARRFSEENADLVRAVIAAYEVEAKWVSENPVEAETIAQKEAGYSDRVRDHLIAYKRRYTLYGVRDEKFLKDFQAAADWLSTRAILPKKVRVLDHLADI
ncbi:NrtA/SsuA/CpmA family ABC transporter substrate-binding protein [Vineibacter terrae]|uniref:NrtA/SsuA/CpmA family ABC transporter substrate-binding protein n=1 Tax=Vineibacter terrae TaxID=2586908 RepID=UPI002E2FEE09|nr:NrtA/SsuA/CpmA family ABC transporter substrate-binding protein [Vineibacter terrae]HEX2888322.1 NrtA/SsuA/CpmA family ABC transporter substrate-binding protein [Vineibacter terrae]